MHPHTTTTILHQKLLFLPWHHIITNLITNLHHDHKLVTNLYHELQLWLWDHDHIYKALTNLHACRKMENTPQTQHITLESATPGMPITTRQYNSTEEPLLRHDPAQTAGT